MGWDRKRDLDSFDIDEHQFESKLSPSSANFRCSLTLNWLCAPVRIVYRRICLIESRVIYRGPRWERERKYLQPKGDCVEENRCITDQQQGQRKILVP